MRCDRAVALTTVKVISEGVVQSKTLADGIILFVQSDKRLHFGVGRAQTARVVVHWSDGLRSEISLPEVNCVLSIRRTAIMHSSVGGPGGPRPHITSQCKSYR